MMGDMACISNTRSRECGTFCMALRSYWKAEILLSNYKTITANVLDSGGLGIYFWHLCGKSLFSPPKQDSMRDGMPKLARLPCHRYHGPDDLGSSNF